MDGLEEKLSALFASPDSMAQIKRLAETLSASGGGEAAKPAPETAAGGDSAPQSGALGLDPKLMQTLMSVLQAYTAPSETASLLGALRPWLREDRCERLDKALRIAKLTRAAKTVLPELGGLRALL